MNCIMISVSRRIFSRKTWVMHCIVITPRLKLALGILTWLEPLVNVAGLHGFLEVSRRGFLVCWSWWLARMGPLIFLSEGYSCVGLGCWPPWFNIVLARFVFIPLGAHGTHGKAARSMGPKAAETMRSEGRSSLDQFMCPFRFSRGPKILSRAPPFL